MKLFWSKFIKAFISGGVASLAFALSAGVSVHTLEEAKHVIGVLVIAFLSGAFHAVWSIVFPTTPTA